MPNMPRPAGPAGGYSAGAPLLAPDGVTGTGRPPVFEAALT